MTSATAKPTYCRTIYAIRIKTSTIIQQHTQHATPTDVAQMRDLSRIVHLERWLRLHHKHVHLHTRDPWRILQELHRARNRASQTLHDSNLLHQALSLKNLLKHLIIEVTQRLNLPNGCLYIPTLPHKLQMVEGACDLATSLLLQPVINRKTKFRYTPISPPQPIHRDTQAPQAAPLPSQPTSHTITD